MAVSRGGSLRPQFAVRARVAPVRPAFRLREGEIVDERVGPMGLFACMLGGDDGRTLFACAAPGFAEHEGGEPRGGDRDARVDVPHAGLP